MGPIGFPETSVRNYYYTLHKRPEERSSHLLRGGSLNTSLDAFLTSGEMLQWHVVDWIWRNIYSQLLDKIQQLTRKERAPRIKFLSPAYEQEVCNYECGTTANR